MKEGCYRTPDNSNLLGPSKKVQVPRREFKENSRKLGNKEMGWGRNEIIMHTSLHSEGQQGIHRSFEKGIK